MPHAPFTGRWMPVPAKQVFDLAAKTSPHTVLVWISMLNDASKNETWRTTRKIETIMTETGLSKPTIIKAQAELIEAGFIEKTPGITHRMITYAVTPIASFRGESPLSDKKDPNSKPVGAWTL